MPALKGRARSVAGEKPARGKEDRKRSLSVASLVLKSTPAFRPPVVKLSVTTPFDVKVALRVPGAKCEGDGLPDVCSAGKTATALYSAPLANVRGATKGTVEVEGFDPVQFAVAAHSDQGASFVHSRGKWRHTVLSAPEWDWRERADKPTEGRAADIEVHQAHFGDRAPVLQVTLRPATELELKRCLQLQALRDAEADGDYDTLHAQITKAKQAGVEWEHLERAEEALRELRRQGRHVADGADKDTLRLTMVWDNITTRPEETGDEEPCQEETCPCNVHINCGEVLEVVTGAVQECLQELCGPEGDRALFEELAASALAVEEGSVWKAGGKFIFSAFDRNQSVIALTRMLHKHGRERCSKMLMALVSYSESKYEGYVTAIQINFHPHGGTFHEQHRDIYSAKQRAGPNCTCSFKKCVGTVCYTVGSSRYILMETMTDEQSAITPCGADCQGRKERRWLHSGDAMYFNESWNANHTHGIPIMQEESGPRISIAFLLGAEEFRSTLFA